MIAGLPVHWVPYYRQPRAPIVLSPHDRVYVQGFDGAQPQHPLRADHVDWSNVIAYAPAHHDSDQAVHRNAHAARATDNFYREEGAE